MRRGGLENWQGRISDSTVKGAVWKYARSEILQGDSTLVQKYPMDHQSTDLVQKSQMDGTSVPKIAMDAKTGQSPLQPPDFLVLYLSLVQDGAHPAGCDREFMSLEPIVKAAARRENARSRTL